MASSTTVMRASVAAQGAFAAQVLDSLQLMQTTCSTVRGAVPSAEAEVLRSTSTLGVAAAHACQPLQ